MNKVVFTAGVLAVCVIGGLFFVAGLFFGTNATTATEKIIEETKDAEPTPDKKGTVIDKLRNLLPSSKTEENKKEQTATDESIIISETKDKAVINLDSLLNEIVATHDTTDKCLTEDVKLLNKEKVTMNSMRRYVVFLGYFQKDMCEEISQLMMAKGYPMHIQTSKLHDNECFLFCGPFKKRRSSENLINWLKANGFKNIRLLSHEVLQTENINIDEFDVEKNKLQDNTDERRKKTRKTKKNKSGASKHSKGKVRNHNVEKDSTDDAQEIQHNAKTDGNHDEAKKSTGDEQTEPRNNEDKSIEEPAKENIENVENVNTHVSKKEHIEEEHDETDADDYENTNDTESVLDDEYSDEEDEESDDSSDDSYEEESE